MYRSSSWQLFKNLILLPWACTTIFAWYGYMKEQLTAVALEYLKSLRHNYSSYLSSKICMKLYGKYSKRFIEPKMQIFWKDDLENATEKCKFHEISKKNHEYHKRKITSIRIQKNRLFRLSIANFMECEIRLNSLLPGNWRWLGCWRWYQREHCRWYRNQAQGERLSCKLECGCGWVQGIFPSILP